MLTARGRGGGVELGEAGVFLFGGCDIMSAAFTEKLAI